MDDLPLESYFQRGILVANHNVARDYETVQNFLSYRTRIHYDPSQDFVVRDRATFVVTRNHLPPRFFSYFNHVLDLIGMDPILPSDDSRDISRWNKSEMLEEILSRVEDLLDSGRDPYLIPNLVMMFQALAWERPPEDDLANITAIIVPGGRTLDRAVEAYRLYLQCQGRACLVVTGRGPYWGEPTDAITESDAFSSHWRMLGVPADHIIAEPDAMNTRENALFLNRVLPREETHKLLLVSSPYHLARFRLNVVMNLSAPAELYALATTINRYVGPEYYFYTDPKAGYDRLTSLGMVFSEYLKIAFDVSATPAKSIRGIVGTIERDPRV